MARTVEWRAGRKVQSTEIPHVFANIPEFVGSPIDVAATTGELVRRRLTDLDPSRDHAILMEVAERLYTDYLALPLRYGNGETGAVLIVNTDRTQGFESGDIDGLRVLADLVAPIVEALNSAHVARTLLDTYLGRRTGRRVPRGDIQRGEGEHIRAAMWFSDLRESTRLS